MHTRLPRAEEKEPKEVWGSSQSPFLFFSYPTLQSRVGIIFASAASMKPITLFSLLIFLAACSSPKKTTAVKEPSSHKVTKTDLLKGGTSFENAIVIKVQTESAGVAEEFKWLAQSYPGYSTIRKTQTSRGSKHYDIITFRTRDGSEKNAYFDITSFFGK